MNAPAFHTRLEDEVAVAETALDQGIERDEDLLACLEAVAKGDFSRRPKGEDALSRAVGRLIDQRIGSAKGALSSLVGQSIAANETSIAVAHVLNSARAVDESASSITDTVSQLVGSIRSISATSEGAASLSRTMANAAGNGRDDAASATEKMARIEDLVKAAADQMESLGQASGDIAVMVETIGKIAAQTNLLALNATIEAARAGEAGKGFAVVASEVKNLSNQTAKATQDIAERIARFEEVVHAIEAAMAESANAVEDGTGMISSLSDAVSKLGDDAHEVDRAMSEIAGVLARQTGAADQIGQGVTTIANQARGTVKEIEKASTSIDKSLNVTQQSLDQVGTYSLDNKDLYLAKVDHVVWKKQVINKLAGREKLNIQDHKQCRLNQWLQSEDARKYKHLSAFSALEEPHRQMHQFGVDAVKKCENGDREGALAAYQELDRLSNTVLTHLDELIAAAS